MKNIQDLSLVDIAENILKQEKTPIDLYDLFDRVLTEKDWTPQNPEQTLNNFYAEMTASAKFVYKGSNEWDLKHNQSIDLWDKDGSYYNEYTEVSDPEMDARIEKQKEAEHKHQEMLEERRQKELELEKQKEAQAAQAVADDVEDVVDPFEDIEDISEDSVEEITIEKEEPEMLEHDIEEGIDEEFEEASEDDFDEDKYLEYMDEYEDEYDK